MESMIFAPLIVSIMLFVGCWIAAASKQQAAAFVCTSVVTLILLCIGSYVLLAAAPNFVEPLIGHFCRGPMGGLVFIFFYAQILPGIASIVAMMFVSCGELISPTNPPNPYGFEN